MRKNFRKTKLGERKEGMVTVNSLFDKYKKVLRAPEKTVTNCFIEVVKDLYNWDVPENSVSYTTRSKKLSVTLSGPFKTEIKLRKKEILTHMAGRIGVKSVPEDIF